MANNQSASENGIKNDEAKEKCWRTGSEIWRNLLPVWAKFGKDGNLM